MGGRGSQFCHSDNLLRPKVNLKCSEDLLSFWDRGGNGNKVWAEVMIESNKYGSLTKTIMYLMQMQIAYCYVKYFMVFKNYVPSPFRPVSPLW